MSKINIGGQAVLEGVMMRSPELQAIAVRTPDGAIVTEVDKLNPLAKRWPILGWPLIRGVTALYEAMAGAISSLNRSAQLLAPEEEIPAWQMALTAVLALALGIGLFFLLPAVLVNPLSRWAPPLVLNMAEGLVRVLLFVGYLFLIGLSRDIRRTFAYHGAEHKSISCWEQGRPLLPEEAATCSRLHPRCGTSFLLLVVGLSILLFSLFTPVNILTKLLLRLALLPLLAGIAYELTRWTAKSKSSLARLVLAPGLLLQKLTTREPDMEQLEVAIAALKAVVDPGES
ncbi:MAG: DUF1385 domain-containing protein [Bacillota bacterium]